jgi:hypothetical protein
MGIPDLTALVKAARRGGRRMLAALAALPHTIGWTGVAVIALLLLAAALRIKGVSWGLPYSYQDPDERVVLLHALRIARGHPDPQFFYYPSMFFDMVGIAVWIAGHFLSPHGGWLASPATFLTDPTPYYLIGRCSWPSSRSRCATRTSP